MDYKQLSLVCELMGLKLEYSHENYIYKYEVRKKKTLYFKATSTIEFVAYKDVIKYLKENYTSQFNNALNQLN